MSKNNDDAASNDIASRRAILDAGKKPRVAGKPKLNSEEGAKVRATYHHRDEDYLLVTHDDLREIKGMGLFQQALFGIGMFLFSGSFWLFISLCAAENLSTFAFTPWMAVCVIAMISGGALGYVGYKMFLLREARLDKYPIKAGEID